MSQLFPSTIFDDATRWLPVASGEAGLKLAIERGALRMDFDFKGGRGFVVARREVQLTLPADFVLRFKVRGRAPVNHFELKLADQSGRNVWRREFKDMRWSARSREVRIPDHEIEFAWGPAGGGAVSEVGAIEFAVVAGEGGVGTVWLSDFEIEDRTLRQPPCLTCSGAREKPRLELDGAFDWMPVRASESDASAQSDSSDPTAKHPWLNLDFHERRLLGGLIIEWEHGAPATGFGVRASISGRKWKTLHQAKRASGSRSYLYLPNTKLRHLRIELNDRVSVRAIRWQRFEFSRSIEAFWHHIAATEPRGWHPRWLMREQSLWTPIGISNGHSCALMNEEGMIEISEGSFSVEPFVEVNGRLFTWADVTLQQKLRDGWQPVPSVVWSCDEWAMEIQAMALADGSLQVRHRFANRAKGSVKVRLLMAIRPFQVTPPWQHFRNVGGVSRIHHLAWSAGAVRVNEAISVVPDEANAVVFGAQTFDEGSLIERLSRGALPESADVHDAFGFASGVMAIACHVEAGQTNDIGWSTARERASPFDWSAKIPADRIQCCAWGADAVRSMLTATSHILITRSGPALQPGPRRYTRSWIRDGTIMSAALLRMGCAEEVRDFIRWYAAFVRDDGFVPCCVDRDGPDWLVEHDSHGQFLSLIANYTRITGDTALLTEQWLRIERNADFIGRLIEPDGLLPISASHEGYLAQPVHSYWDDFWAVRGLRDAAEMAARLNHDDEAMRWRELADKLHEALLQSIASTRAAKQLDYIPGSLEWADFDPTATANAVTLFEMERGHPRSAERRKGPEQRTTESTYKSERKTTPSPQPSPQGRGSSPSCRSNLEASMSLRRGSATNSLSQWERAGVRGNDPGDLTDGGIEVPPTGQECPFSLDLALDDEALTRTFDKYLIDWRKKRRGEMEWSNYSPYEIRIIGALVRLGRREDALELLRFFLSDRRPLAWNQWPEIAWRDPRSPGHIGDMPHTWIGAEYVLALQSLFAFESESRKAVVIAAGIAAEWMDDEGVWVNELPMSCGRLSYSLRRFPDGLMLCEVRSGIDLPAGGLILRPPLSEPMWRVTINDEVVEARGLEEIRIDFLPATIAIHPLSHA